MGRKRDLEQQAIKKKSGAQRRGAAKKRQQDPNKLEEKRLNTNKKLKFQSIFNSFLNFL
jgi:hypothetical protein